MDKNSNKYTFLFAFVMVVVVGVLLAGAATFLKPKQVHNAQIEKMRAILNAIDIKASVDDADQVFNQYIQKQSVLNKNGVTLKDTLSAFDVDLHQEEQKERQGEGDQRLYPLFIGKKEGKKFYIIPMRGRGLWGPIWGYLALEEDFNTIYGANFDHKSETPGLGAEISKKSFESQFKGKKILDNEDNFVSVKVVKGGVQEDNPHAVDAISGGTITSVGVSDMIYKTLAVYMSYYKNKPKNAP